MGASNASNINKYSLSGEEHYQAIKDIFGEGNVEWASKTTISYTSKKYNSICIFKDSDGWHTKYIDSYGNEYLKTIGQTKSRCIQIAFMQIYSLFLVDKLISNCIRKGYLEKTLSVDYILYFLGSK